MIGKEKDIAWKENVMIIDAITVKENDVIVVHEARKFVIVPKAGVENAKSVNVDDQSMYKFIFSKIFI